MKEFVFQPSIHVQGIGNPMKIELFHAEPIMQNSQAGCLCNAEAPVKNLA
jgi:hypothetical protein